LSKADRDGAVEGSGAGDARRGEEGAVGGGGPLVSIFRGCFGRDDDDYGEVRWSVGGADSEISMTHGWNRRVDP
jgi:hypothetical protein